MEKEEKLNKLYKEKNMLGRKLKNLEDKIEKLSERLEDAIFTEENISENKEKYANIEKQLTDINRKIEEKQKRKKEKDIKIESDYNELNGYLGFGTTAVLLCILMPMAYQDAGYMVATLIASPVMGIGSSKIITSKLCNIKKKKNKNNYDKSVEGLLEKKNLLETKIELFDRIPEKEEINSLVEEASKVKIRIESINKEIEELGVTNNFKYSESTYTLCDEIIAEFDDEFDNKPKIK